LDGLSCQSTVTEHDNKRDRAQGAFWERQFSIMVGHHGWMVTRHQEGRDACAVAYTYKNGVWRKHPLPDVTILTAAVEHQEGRDACAVAYTYKNGVWRKHPLPDVTILTAAVEHHEIRHKAPFCLRNSGMPTFGLEAYRLEHLLTFARETGETTMYTIHNHALNGGNNATDNHIKHWFTVNVLDLENRQVWTQPNGKSYVNGEYRSGIPIYYWPISMWMPLEQFWQTRRQR